MATTFSLLNPDDADRLAGLIHQWHRADGVALDVGTARRSLGTWLDDSGHGHAWLIETAGTAIGYIMLSFTEVAGMAAPRAYVSALYLAPEWRARGFGRRALDFLREVSRFLQVRVVTFDIEREQKHAHFLHRPGSWSPRVTSLFNQAVA